jgi:hypothetical protein
MACACPHTSRLATLAETSTRPEPEQSRKNHKRKRNLTKNKQNHHSGCIKRPRGCDFCAVPLAKSRISPRRDVDRRSERSFFIFCFSHFVPSFLVPLAPLYSLITPSYYLFHLPFLPFDPLWDLFLSDMHLCYNREQDKRLLSISRNKNALVSREEIYLYPLSYSQ